MTTFYWVGNSGGYPGHTGGTSTNLNELGTGAGPSDWNYISLNNCYSQFTNWATIGSATGGWTGGANDLFLNLATRFPVAGDSAVFTGFTGSIDGANTRRYPMSECLYGGVSGEGLGQWPGGTNESGLSASYFSGKLTELYIDDYYDQYLFIPTGGEPPQRTRFGIDMAREFATPFKVGEWNGLGIAAVTYKSYRRRFNRSQTDYPLYGVGSTPEAGNFDQLYKTKLYGNVDIDDMFIYRGDSIEIRRNAPEDAAACASAPGVTIDRIYLERDLNPSVWDFYETGEGGAPNNGSSAGSIEFNMIGDSQKFSITGIVKDTSEKSWGQLFTSRTAIPTVILGPKERWISTNQQQHPSHVGVGYATTRLDCEVENLTIHPNYGEVSGPSGDPDDNGPGTNSQIWLGAERGQSTNGISYGNITLAANNEYWSISGTNYNNDVIIDCAGGFGVDGGTNAAGGGTIDNLVIQSGWIRPHSGTITDNTHCVVMGGQIGDVGVLQTYGQTPSFINNWTGLELSGQTSGYSTEGPGMLVTSSNANIKILPGTKISTTAGTADRATAFGVSLQTK